MARVSIEYLGLERERVQVSVSYTSTCHDIDFRCSYVQHFDRNNSHDYLCVRFLVEEIGM